MVSAFNCTPSDSYFCDCKKRHPIPTNWQAMIDGEKIRRRVSSMLNESSICFWPFQITEKFMKSSSSRFLIAALTAATLALPAAAAFAADGGAKCSAKSEMHKCAAKCAGKCAAKCKAKCKAKCEPKCAAKCAPKCAAKCKAKCGPK